MKERDHYDVVIVGAGFAGAMTAVQLARTAPQLRVRLCDTDGSSGRGVAYGTSSARHLLNVPAAKMSAFAGEPRHFLEWLRRTGCGEASAGTFAQRRVYGSYLAELLKEATTLGQLTHVCSRVTDVSFDAGKLLIEEEDGHAVVASAVVLALGNLPPRPIGGADRIAARRIIRSPWRPDALSAIQQEDDVLIIGSGLTAVDVLLSLEQQQARGKVHLISRRGLLPLPHQAHEMMPQLFDSSALPANVRRTMRRVRHAAAEVRGSGGDWRAVVDALRPHSQSWWARLPMEERRRFLRHVRSFWDVHRHRVAPDVINVIPRFRESGQLIQHRGRIRSIASHEGGVRVEFSVPPAAATQSVEVAFVINCTGPESNYARVDDPLVRNLIGRGMIVPDELGLGIRTNEQGGLIAADDSVSANLFTLGSARKPELWETTAVPELRVQAEQLARHLAFILQ